MFGVLPIAANTAPFHAMAVQLADVGKVREVQVIPSGEVLATLLLPTAQNTVPFQAMAFQNPVADRARCVHVIPSEEVAAIAVAANGATYCAMAQNTVPFHAIACHQTLETGSVR